jgi:drug/metabolite transporter superfamily protein YnfA
LPESSSGKVLSLEPVMSTIGLRHPQGGSKADSEEAATFDRRISIPLIVAASSLLLAAAAMSRSFYDGRLASPITHNDVNYFLIGIRYVVMLREQGFSAIFNNIIHTAQHAPITSYQAMLAYLIFGINDWSPYVSNLVYVLLFLGVVAYLVRDCPVVMLVASVLTVISMPLTSATLTEFAPELVCSLFTAIGAVLMLRLPLVGAPLGPRLRAGFCFCLGFLAHPSAFAFTLVAMLGTLGLMFLREVIFIRTSRFEQVLMESALSLVLSTWFAALYIVPRFDVYWDYFYRTTLNPATRVRWVDAGMSLHQHIFYYLTGQGGQFMFGNRLLGCSAIVGCGVVAAWWRHDMRSMLRLVELLLVAILFWLVPTLSPVKVAFFAAAFGYAFIFLTVMALRSIFDSLPAKIAGTLVSIIALLLLTSDTSHVPIPNTPRTLVDREFSFRAINRLKADLFGNAADYLSTRVYMTNIGAYANNILEYYMLKVDPSMHWQFDAGYFVTDPQEQLAYIHSHQEDFVIAGHFNNGFTYSPWAQPAEEPVLRAMSHDSGYIPIDRFYGPSGRTVTVFQRRGNFAGWHAVTGIANGAAGPNNSRVTTGGIAYLETYASRAVAARLQLNVAGMAGQTVDILVNQQKIASLVFSVGKEVVSLDQSIMLLAGTNDIVLQYPTSGRITLHQLLIIPSIGPEG